MKITDYINAQKLSIQVMVDKIEKGEHFAFGRMGDGEFDAILGESGGNCDGHKYFPNMGRDLANVILNWNGLNYYLGLHMSKRIGPKTVRWFERNGITNERKWAENHVFHVALVNGEVDKFYKAIEGKKIVLVGPRRLRDQNLIEVETFVEVPIQNSYEKTKEIVAELLSIDLKNRIVLFCSGPPTAIFIDRIWKVRQDCTLIDYGSNFDPNIKVRSRSFHRKLKR